MGRDHLERPECESQQRDDYHQVDYAHHSMLPPGTYLPIWMRLGDKRMLAPRLRLRRSSSAATKAYRLLLNPPSDSFFLVRRSAP